MTVHSMRVEVQVEPAADAAGTGRTPACVRLQSALSRLLALGWWGTAAVVIAAAVKYSAQQVSEGLAHAALCAGHAVGLGAAAWVALRPPRWRLTLNAGRLLSTQRRVLIWLLLVAAVRLVWIWAVPTTPYSDGAIYEGLARRLLATGEYNSGMSRAYWPPGYPLWIAGVYALFGPSIAAIKISHVLLAGLTEWCLYRWVRGWAGVAPAALAVLLLAAWPSRAVRLDLLSYDDLAMFLVAAALALMPRWTGGFADRSGIVGPVRLLVGRSLGRWWVSGILLGAAALTRPPLVLVGAAVALWLAVQGGAGRPRVLGAAALIAGMAAVMVPWGVRNQQVLGRFVPLTTNSGVNLYLSFAPGGDGAYFAPAHTELVAATGGDRAASELAIDRAGWRRTAELVKADPAAVLYRALVQKPVHYFGSDNVVASLDAYRALWPGQPAPAAALKTAALLACNAYYMLLMLAPLLWVRHARRGIMHSTVATLSLLIFFSGCLVHIIFPAQPRYHIIYMPFWTTAVAVLAHYALLHRNDGASNC